MKFSSSHLAVALLSFGLTTGAYSWWLAPIPVSELPDAPSSDLQHLSKEVQTSRAVYRAAAAAYRKIKQQYGKKSIEAQQALQRAKAARKVYRRSRQLYDGAEEAWFNGLHSEEQ